MKISLTLQALLIPLASIGVTLPAFTQEATPKPVHLGKQDRFWAARPVLNPWLERQLGLVDTEDLKYLADPALTFPAQLRPYPKQVPFADYLNVVRFLGGCKKDNRNADSSGPEGDLVYRDKNGELRYRWDRIGVQIDHYVENGYDLTIVLDNTPWCLPETPKSVSYGNVPPPADMEEWRTFIAEMCRQLVKRYGQERVSRWRFRFGTEYSGVKRFSGTQEQYLEMYDLAAAAVKEIIPGAQFGPFNQAGGKHDPDAQNVSYFAIADHCAEERVTAPMDFMCASHYLVFPNTNKPRYNPEQRADGLGQFWDEVAARHPKYAATPREIHELGTHGGPGARGAAWLFHFMFRCRERGMTRMYHWGTELDGVRGPQGRMLLTGHGWLFCVLDNTIGRDAWILPVTPETDSTTQFKCAAFVGEKETTLLLSAFDEAWDVDRQERLRIPIPAKLLPGGGNPTVRSSALTYTNTLHYQAREDLRAEGLFKEEFREELNENPHLIANVLEMTTPAGRRFIESRWETYKEHTDHLLTTQPFQGQVASTGEGLELTLDTPVPSLTAITIQTR